MKQVTLTRKHKIALTSNLGDAPENVLRELVALGLVEKAGKGHRLSGAGRAKAEELKRGLTRPESGVNAQPDEA
jgi:ribosomal protein S19E (S16A)